MNVEGMRYRGSLLYLRKRNSVLLYIPRAVRDFLIANGIRVDARRYRAWITGVTIVNGKARLCIEIEPRD